MYSSLSDYLPLFYHIKEKYTRTGTADRTAVPVNCLMGTALFCRGLVFALPIFPGRPRYCHAVRNSPVDCCRHKKHPDISVGGLCSRYLSSQVGQGIVMPSATVQWTVASIKNTPTFLSGLVFALPIFPGRPRYCHAVRNSPVDCCRHKKHPDISVGVLCSRYLSSQAVARQVLSAQMSLTSVFGMGTGGPSPQSTPTGLEGLPLHLCQKSIDF